MGTISIPDPLPPPVEDCKKLRKAFQGWGTDEKAIIEILGHRNAAQRAIITQTYHQLYNESLLQRLQSELSGHFGRAIILWATDPAERDAKLVNEALRKKGTQQLWVIIEISCASSPDHLMSVRKAYCSLFKSSLEEDIESHFAHQKPLAHLLVRLVSSYRYDGDRVDEALAKSEAGKLYDAITMKQPYHEQAICILGTRSRSQLKETFKHYKQDFGKSIDEDIETNRGSNVEKITKTLKLVVLCINSPEKHFAEVVRKSVVGLGTDEDSLTRAIIARAEIDMVNIKEEYEMRYKRTVVDDELLLVLRRKKNPIKKVMKLEEFQSDKGRKYRRWPMTEKNPIKQGMTLKVYYFAHQAWEGVVVPNQQRDGVVTLPPWVEQNLHRNG